MPAQTRWGSYKQARRHQWTQGNTRSDVGKQRKCPECGSMQYGKKIWKNEYNDRMQGVWCSNCGYNKPLWARL